MKKILLIITCLIANIALAQEPTTTIYLIRHAEKAADGTADPELSDAGMERAQKWGKYFDDKNISTYCTTVYKRAKMTALEISSTFAKMPEPGTERNFKMKTYDPMTFSLKDLSEKLKGENIVIIGHSNTIPTLVNNFIGERKYPDIQESEFGNLYIIKITGDKITHEMVQL